MLQAIELPRGYVEVRGGLESREQQWDARLGHAAIVLGWRVTGAQDKAMGQSEKKRGAPVQPETGRKLAVLGMMIKQADGAIPLIDLCRAVAQMDPEFFRAELSAPKEVVLQAIARGRNTISEATWARLDEAAQREAERDLPADASGARSSRARKRFEARVRAVRIRLCGEERDREAARLQLFDAGAAALKTAFYSLSDAARTALGADPFGAYAVSYEPDLFPSEKRWTLG